MVLRHRAAPMASTARPWPAWVAARRGVVGSTGSATGLGSACVALPSAPATAGSQSGGRRRRRRRRGGSSRSNRVSRTPAGGPARGRDLVDVAWTSRCRVGADRDDDRRRARRCRRRRRGAALAAVHAGHAGRARALHADAVDGGAQHLRVAGDDARPRPRRVRVKAATTWSLSLEADDRLAVAQAQRATSGARRLATPDLRDDGHEHGGARRTTTVRAARPGRAANISAADRPRGTARRPRRCRARRGRRAARPSVGDGEHRARASWPSTDARARRGGPAWPRVGAVGGLPADLAAWWRASR